MSRPRLAAIILAAGEGSRLKSMRSKVLHEVAGRTLVNIVSDGVPSEGFVPVEATLEDVYFAAISGRLNAAVAEVEAA